MAKRKQTQKPPNVSEAQPTEQHDRQAMSVDQENPPKLDFPVVAVGASAGGLEAFIEFITGVQPDSGMAFVFILHLPPDRESLLAEILSPKTKMVVRQVEERMEIQANCVYVTRPGHVLNNERRAFPTRGATR